MEAISKTIQVPPITPNGTVLLTKDEMDAFKKDFDMVKDVAGTMANIAICLIHMLDDEGKDEVLVDRELIERVKGSQLVLREDAVGNVVAKITRRAPSLIAVDGRNG